MKRVIFLFVAAAAALMPLWPYSRDWGYAPSLGACSLALILMALRMLRAI
jgi:hypothetical protein